MVRICTIQHLGPQPLPCRPTPSAFHSFHSHPWPLCPLPTAIYLLRFARCCSALSSTCPLPTRFHDLHTAKTQHYPFPPPHPVFRPPKKIEKLALGVPGFAGIAVFPPDHPSAPPTVFVCYLVRAGGGRPPPAPPPPARVRQPCAPHFERTAPVPRPLAFLPVPLTPDTPACVTPNPPQSPDSAHARCPSRTVPRSSPSPPAGSVPFRHPAHLI